MGERSGLARELLLPVRENLAYAIAILTNRQHENGTLSDWEKFSLILCLTNMEAIEIAIEHSDFDGFRETLFMIRLIDDSIFAVRWPEVEWWEYVARTKNTRNTLEFILNIQRELDSGSVSVLTIHKGFTESLKFGLALLQSWELERILPGCVGQVSKVSI